MTQQERVTLARELALASNSGHNSQSCGCGTASALQDSQTLVASLLNAQSLNQLIDCSLDLNSASAQEVEKFLQLARSGSFHSACVQPSWTAKAVQLLKGSKTRVKALVGYPHGTALTPVKCLEAETALRLGADEIEMIANIGSLRSGDLDAAYIDIKAVAGVVECRGVLLSVTVELPHLTERQKIDALVVAKLAGAACVVSSSGHEGSFANTADIQTMKRVVGGLIHVKANGGILSMDDVQSMLHAGASHIGTSHGQNILQSVTR